MFHNKDYKSIGVQNGRTWPILDELGTQPFHRECKGLAKLLSKPIFVVTLLQFECFLWTFFIIKHRKV